MKESTVASIPSTLFGIIFTMITHSITNILVIIRSVTVGVESRVYEYTLPSIPSTLFSTEFKKKVTDFISKLI